MKIKFCCDSGANIHSKNHSEWVDVEELSGLTEEEWKSLSEDEKYEEAVRWAWENGLEVWFEEQE